MMSGTHETAPHGLAALTAHPRGALGGLGMHGCLGGGRIAAAVAVGDLPVMYLPVMYLRINLGPPRVAYPNKG